MSIGFKLPIPIKITGRTSSITNAFYNAIVPIISPTEDEIKRALEILEMPYDDVRCAYCGDKATEWDHLNPLIRGKGPTGFITEISNLIPACGKCNQSKGNKIWKDWIKSNAKLSPLNRGIKDLDLRISRIEKFEISFRPKKYSFREIIENKLWDDYVKMNEDLHKMMYEAQIRADEIRNLIKNKLEAGDLGITQS